MPNHLPLYVYIKTKGSGTGLLLASYPKFEGVKRAAA